MALHRPLAPPVLTKKEVVAIARDDSLLVKRPYTIHYGSWSDPGLRLTKPPFYHGQVIDAWEVNWWIRVPKTGTFHHIGKRHSCYIPWAFHHFVFVIGDKSRRVIEGEGYWSPK
jgi:hypothetical protein